MGQAIEELITQLSRLPGIGRKTAQRLAFHLLKAPPEEALQLAEAIRAVRERISLCSVCSNLTEGDPCAICRDPQRDCTVLCVVERPSDIAAIERTGSYRGLYHVLRGVLSPLDGVGPEDLTTVQLLRRLEAGTVKEIIIATNPSVEGEVTALYLHKVIAPRGIIVSRIARGLPVGGDIEYADEVTIAQALEGRQELR